MYKLYTGLALAFAFLLVTITSAHAAPYKAADKNPQTVAFYEEGIHGIPGHPFLHMGTNMVKRNGNSGNFQAWFWGTSEEEGEHGHHEVWQIAKNGTCPDDAVFIADAHENWGDYLVEDADYCVLINEYHASHADETD